MNRKKRVAFFSGAAFLLWGVRALADCNSQPWTFAGSTVTTNCGNVGIGTSSPGGKLTIVRSSTYGNESSAGLILSDTSYPYNIQMNVGVDNAAGAAYVQTQVPTGYAKNLTLQPMAGNVGIGTTHPLFKLDVAGAVHITGDIIVDGNIAAKYQDVAEWVPASESMPPGTVVVIDDATRNGVRPSSGSYDTAVAGVVSAQPGLILGEGGQAKEKIATTGRVRVRVDASHAPIRTGDLLVTSEKSGMAMRSEPVEVTGIRMHRPGTLLGKALEPLERGEGEILVLLSLQ